MLQNQADAIMLVKAVKILHQNHVANGKTNCIKKKKTISKENPFQNRRKS